jgi:hypothetical protein
MKRVRLSSLLMCSVLLLLCAAQSISAQKPRTAGTSVERRGSSTRSADRITQRAPGASTNVEGRATGEPAVPLNAARVHIRYKKAMGYANTSPFGNSGPYTCGAFAVSATALLGAPGTLGSEKAVGTSIVREAIMRELGDYYICDFTITDLPLNKTITIRASIGPEPQYVTGRWEGGTEPQPPPGYKRALNYGGMRSVTLSSRSLRAFVDFVMEFRPINSPGQPR